MRTEQEKKIVVSNRKKKKMGLSKVKRGCQLAKGKNKKNHTRRKKNMRTKVRLRKNTQRINLGFIKFKRWIHVKIHSIL